MLELRVRGEGCGEQYEAALRQLGTNVNDATPAERCAAAVEAQPRPYMVWLFTMP
jgi:hypothetical protein